MKHVLAALVMMSIVGVAVAADKPNFSGDWKMNVSKSNYGQIPPPESFTRKIVHAEPTITITEEQTGPGANPTSTRKMTTDGNAADIDLGVPVKVSAAWEGTMLIATTTIDTAGVKFVDKMSLSKDAKELTSLVQIESAQGNAEIKIVFDRQ